MMSVRAALVALALVAACQKSEPRHEPVPPSPALIAAMKDYCNISQMPEDKQREALKLWGWHNGGDQEVGPLWTRAVKGKDPAAIATTPAAADAAVGPGNCPLLDNLK